MVYYPNSPAGMFVHYFAKLETRKLAITSFHFIAVCCFVNKHTKHDKLITWSQTDYPSLVKNINCTLCAKQDQDVRRGHKASSHLSYHTVRIHPVCHDTERNANYGRLSPLTWKVSRRYSIATNFNCCHTCMTFSRTCFVRLLAKQRTSIKQPMHQSIDQSIS